MSLPFDCSLRAKSRTSHMNLEVKETDQNTDITRKRKEEEEKGLGKKFTFGKKVFSSEVDVSTSESACALMCLVNSTTSLGWVGKKGMSGTDSENGKNGKIQTRGDQEPFHRCCLLSCK